MSLSKPVNPNDDYNLLITTATKAATAGIPFNIWLFTYHLIRFSKAANNASSLLPPLLLDHQYPSKKTVVLDLDETLIHCAEIYDYVFQGREKRVYKILKRPFFDEFLQCLSENGFEIVVFTAGTKCYASPTLDLLDPKRLITHRLYRESCKEVDGNFIKDLSCLGRDLRKVVIVDDRPGSYSLNPKNGIPIKPFTDDLHDDELLNLMGYFRENRDELFFKKFEKTKDYRNNGKDLQRLKVEVEELPDVFRNSLSI